MPGSLGTIGHCATSLTSNCSVPSRVYLSILWCSGQVLKFDAARLARTYIIVHICHQLVPKLVPLGAHHGLRSRIEIRIHVIEFAMLVQVLACHSYANSV